MEPGAANRLDEFFMRFGGECYQMGFQRSERLVPAGFPVLPFHPVYRYRRSEDAAGSPALYQIGAGLFSANALPPYRSWSAFAQIVADGVRALLKTRPSDESATAFSSASLRYINAFGPDFLQGRTSSRFISDVLGFRVELPEAVRAVSSPVEPFGAVLQLTIPAANGLRIAMMVGEGVVTGASAVMLDTTVSSVGPVEPDEGVLMRTFDSARSIIHDSFVALTRPLHEFMGPEEE